jgi:hypothetical protein
VCRGRVTCLSSCGKQMSSCISVCVKHANFSLSLCVFLFIYPECFVWEPSKYENLWVTTRDAWTSQFFLSEGESGAPTTSMVLMDQVTLPADLEDSGDDEVDAEMEKFRSACQPRAANVDVRPKKVAKKRPAADTFDATAEISNVAAGCPASANDPLAPAGACVPRAKAGRREKIHFQQPRETLGILGCTRCRLSANGCGTLANPGCRQSHGWLLQSDGSFSVHSL